MARNGDLFTCSNEGSDSAALASSGTIEECKVEDVMDQVETPNAVNHLDAPVSGSQNESPDVEVVPSETLLSETTHFNSNLEFRSRASCENHEYNMIQTPKKHELPIYGTLYYEPPQLDNNSVILDSDLLHASWMQCHSDSSPNLYCSPFFTPPSVKSGSFLTQTPESILKIAAKSFPNTPSILRKRKTEAHLSTPPNKDGGADRDATGSISHHSDEHGRSNNIEKPRLPDGDLLKHSDDFVASGNGKPLNASPPYRLRSKRTSVSKSVEKQLEFALTLSCDAKVAGDSNVK